MSEVVFKKVDYTVNKLLEDIDIGNIGLPDIQRPFVWGTSKVRDLFDSMYRGFPIGYFLFWENGLPGEHRAIGKDKKQKAPTLLIVDGQQRLTSIYAVIKGKEVIDKDFRSIKIRLAFNPIEEKFEVTNPAIERNPIWISDISILWNPSTNILSYVSEFINNLTKRLNLDEREQKRIYKAIDKLVDLQNYPLTALEVSASISEEHVAEIFVRINSKGTPLNQADFILTLMSVFWDDGRKELENFCRSAKIPPFDKKPSPYNPYLTPSPDQLLRVSVALGFHRARLEYVYLLLRGKDLQTGQFSIEQRDKQFELLKRAQAIVLDLQNWHDFFKVLNRAGYIHRSMITSETTIIYTYALWLIGKHEFHVDDFSLRKIMAQWFFMASLTGRYTESPESRMEEDLAMLRGISNPDEFCNILKQQIAAILTKDYWELTLPNELSSAAAQSTGQFAFYAALCILDAPILYSNMKIRDVLKPDIQAKKAPIERHHLFPRKYLPKIGVKDRRDINQIANYALIEWKDDIIIRDSPPKEYAPKYEKRFTTEDLSLMYYYHALPEKWYEMDYFDFLIERRKRMAEIIHEGFMRLQK